MQNIIGGSKTSVLLMVSGASLQFPQKHTISPYPKPVKPKAHKSLETGSPGDSICMVASDTVDTITAVYSFT
jgi:cytochrome c oxidase assembly factor CtaG